MFFGDLALGVFVLCREILVNDDGARGTRDVFPGEEVFNVEASELVVPSKGVGFLPLRSHSGRRDRWRRVWAGNGGRDEQGEREGLVLS